MLSETLSESGMGQRLGRLGPGRLCCCEDAMAEPIKGARPDRRERGGREAAGGLRNGWTWANEEEREKRGE